MRQLRTRGQPAALEAVGAAALGRLPHAVLLVGPPSVGKTTLALDVAASLLCGAAAVEDRPCGVCRGCRLVGDGNHPDLHRLRPTGPGGQVGIAQVRELGAALALLPVEGGARVALVESAHRLNEDAQNALLKTLEEPPSGVTILLVVDDEERLLPTVRSRCARFRLGPTGSREIEALVTDLGLADAPTAARFARIAGGRPGLAVAYARAPEAAAARGQIARLLLDLITERPTRRLAAARDLLASAGAAADALDAASGPDARAAVAADARTSAGRPAGPQRLAAGVGDDAAVGAPAAVGAAVEGGPVSDDGAEGAPGTPDVPAGMEAGSRGQGRLPAAARRRAAVWLIEAWRDAARDLVLVARGGRTGLRMPELLEEYVEAAAILDATELSVFLARCVRAGERLELNVSPELEIDALVLAWPEASGARRGRPDDR
jgi:DNA polymerase III delta' subunit